jgi:hypothetical protein
MVATKTKQEAFSVAYGEILPAIRTQIQSSSVMLSGGVSGAFKASAVILTFDATYTYIATAAHSMYVLARAASPPTWSVDLIKIVYGRTRTGEEMNFGLTPQNEAAVSEIRTMHYEIDPLPTGKTQDDPSVGNWEYDLMILRSSDANLRTYADKRAVYQTTGALPKAGGFAAEALMYLGNSADKKKPHFLVQTGFGNIQNPAELVGDQRIELPANRTRIKKGTTKSESNLGNNLLGALQYRIVTLNARATASHYNQIGETTDYAESKDCVSARADADDSTETGDSGGPLFIAHYVAADKAYKLDLIGITTGADMAPSETPCPVSPAVRVNNISTSMEPYYKRDVKQNKWT